MATGSTFTLGSIRRRLLTGSAWVFGARVAGLFLGVALNGVIARLLDPSGFGDYLLISTMVVIGSTVAKLGMDRAVVRFTAGSLAVGEPGGAGAAIRIAVGWAALGAGAVGLILAFGLGQWFFGDVLGQPVVASLVPVAAGWLFATAMQSVLAESFRGLSRFGYAAVFHVLATDLATVTVLGGVYLSSRNASLPQVVALSTAVATGVLVITGLLLLRTTRSLRGAGQVKRSDMFRVARPLMITNLGIYLLGHGVDLWILGAFRPDEVVSLYGAAAKLVVLVATPMIIFSGVMPPLVAELHAQGKIRQLERTLRAGAALVGLPAFAVLLVFIVAGPWVLETVYGPYYGQAAPLLVIMSIARVLAVWTGSCGIALMMTGHQKDMMRTTLVSVVLSIGGGLAAVPRFGAMGLAVATGLAQVFQNGTQLLLAHRRLGLWTYVSFSPAVLRDLVGRRRPINETPADDDVNDEGQTRSRET
jgi:O-antigen/teichoic acid export membrane protein